MLTMSKTLAQVLNDTDKYALISCNLSLFDKSVYLADKFTKSLNATKLVQKQRFLKIFKATSLKICSQYLTGATELGS